MVYATRIYVLTALAITSLRAQSSATLPNPAPSLFDVLSYSSVFNQKVYDASGDQIGLLSNAVPNVYAYKPTPNVALSDLSGSELYSLKLEDFTVDTSIMKVNSAVNSSIATALGLIPLPSPASGVIYARDPSTGLEVQAPGTLGPIFTERAETIGRHRIYIGFSHEDFHFTKLNGESLNAIQVLYPGGDASGVTNKGTTLTSYPATFDLGMDVRLSEDVAFVTVGVTDRLDLSVGLPVVHAAMAARTYNGILYNGGGLGAEAGNATNVNCWCAATFNPGALVMKNPAEDFTQPDINHSSLSKTGFGDLLVRAKGT